MEIHLKILLKTRVFVCSCHYALRFYEISNVLIVFVNNRRIIKVNGGHHARIE